MRNLATVLALLLLPLTALAQGQLEAAPESGDGDAALLPLVDERLDVTLENGHATATLLQVFQSESEERQEGRYRLALGGGARVLGFAYWNGEKKIVGEVFEKQTARAIYADVTGLGRDPGLLEEEGEGTFGFRIFPIEPGERKRVEIRYGKLLETTAGVAELRVPLASPGARITVAISDDRPIAAIESPSHKLTVETRPGGATVKASGGGELVLRVRLAEPALQLRARLHRDPGQDAYVLVSMQAPGAADAAVAPKDVTLVIDHSGSMDGAPLLAAKGAADAILAKLRAEDRVNVAFFDDDVRLLYPAPQPLTPEVRAAARAAVAALESDGGTNLALALERVLAAQTVDERPDVILFLTDGQSDSVQALAAAAKAQAGTRLFTVGLGSGVQRPLLARLAADAHGRFTFIPDAAAIAPGVVSVFERIDHPVLLDVEVAGLARVYPRALPDLTRGEELVVAGRLRADGTITVSGTLDGKRISRSLTVVLPASTRQAWVGRTWAAARVDDLLEQIALAGETEELKTEAVELALAYELCTPYTSFLAIPEEETAVVADTLADARARKQAILAAHADAAALSRDDMPPGDPVLSVKAPENARQVTARFPFGLVKDLAWDPRDESWKVRFLVPQDVPDGEYEAEVVIVRADGAVEIARVPYRIDSLAPDFEAELVPAPGGVIVRVRASDGVGLVTVALVADPARRLTLAAVGPGRFEGYLALPAGPAALRVVVADTARNEADEILEVR